MSKKTVLFDLDGTLTDTLDGIRFCVNHTMDEMSLPHVTREQCRAFVGNGAKVLLQKSLIAVCGSDERLGEAESLYGTFFKNHCCDEVTVYPGVHDMLCRLVESGYAVGIVTNKPHEASCIVADTLMGDIPFVIIRGQINGQPRKPEKALMDEVISKLSVEIDDCIFVGDSEVDVTTGANSGMTTIAVTWGFRTKEQLKEAGATYFASTADELESIIKSV